LFNRNIYIIGNGDIKKTKCKLISIIKVKNYLNVVYLSFL